VLRQKRALQTRLGPCRRAVDAVTKMEEVLNGVYMNVIFSVGCNSHIWHRTKDRINPIFCAVLDAAVASNTENHSLC
jgi:hypothetical protein